MFRRRERASTERFRASPARPRLCEGRSWVGASVVGERSFRVSSEYIRSRNSAGARHPG
jgi:hypothetical protein